MPGSLLTLMTGGLIKPIVHRVRDDRSTAIRQLLTFFISPSLQYKAEPWVADENHQGDAIGEMAIASSADFGLPSLTEAMLK